MSKRSENYKISFIIPVLNGERFIPRCLDHIMKEKAPDDEVILVDNGSTDRTLEIARGYNLTKILEKPGRTVAALRNHGAENASGELLAFIDSDCLVSPGWRENVIKVMQDPQIAATGSRYSISPDATWLERAWFSAKSKNAKRVTYINSGNLIVRSEQFNQINGFRADLETDEDYDLAIRLRTKGHYILDDPSIKSIHLGNAKTTSEFYKKIRWHATGGLKLKTDGFLDKPMIMTMIFIISWISALALIPFAVITALSPIWIAGLILLVPVITVIFRTLQYGNFRHFFQLIYIYIIYYIARSLTFIKLIFNQSGAK